MRNVIRPLSVCLELLALGIFGALLVTLRYFWKTPQPLENVLPGVPRLYKWTYGHVYYKILGVADAPPLVLLHAPEIGASSYEMRNVIEGLAQRYRIYAPDLLGFGLSDRPRENYTAEMYVRLLRDFLTGVVAQPATLLASGLSCNYGVALAGSYPELCRRLILLSPITLGRGGRPPTWLARLMKNAVFRFMLYALLTPAPLLRRVIAWQRGVEAWQVPDEDLKHIFASAHQFGAEHAAFARITGWLDNDVSQQFKELQQPTLIIWGEQALSKAQKFINQHTISSRIQVILVEDRAGRVQEAYPDKVVGNVLQWQAEEEQAERVRSSTEQSSVAADKGMLASAPEAGEAALSDAVATETSRRETLDAVANVQAIEDVEAYCVKCRQKRAMRNPQRVVTKKGRNALEGSCPECGTKLYRFVRS